MPIFLPFRSARVLTGLSAATSKRAHGCRERDEDEFLTLGALLRHPKPVRHDHIHLAAQKRHLRCGVSGKLSDLQRESVCRVKTVMADRIQFPPDGSGRQRANAQIRGLRRDAEA